METSKVLQALAALAQETRLAVYRLLVEHAPEGLPAGQVAERLGLAPPSLSFHLKELDARRACRPAARIGRFVWYRADLDAMNGLVGLSHGELLPQRVPCATRACEPRKAKRPVARVAMPRRQKRRRVGS